MMILLSLLVGALSAEPQALFNQEPAKYEIVVNNRVLAKVGDKAISLLDVVKRMDFVFFQEYPQYADQPEARYRFYQAAWKGFLNDTIERELILADAAAVKMEVKPGEVRPDLEKMFGPNVIQNLDISGLTMSEAVEILTNEALINRMMHLRVRMKAEKHTSPGRLKKAYEKHLEEREPAALYTYRVITVSDIDSDRLSLLGDDVVAILEGGVTPEELPSKIRKTSNFRPLSDVKVSKSYHHKESEISPKFREGLEGLAIKKPSQPIPHTRKGGETVLRIFYIEDLIEDNAPSFVKVEKELKMKVMNDHYDSERIAYVQRLRKEYGVDEKITNKLMDRGYQPFELIKQ